jgi:RNA polymerase sigma-70 factor (ECF subfamily)
MRPRPALRLVAPSEAELIEACRRGERSAQDAVFRAESTGLEWLIRRLVGPTPDVPDLLQVTFVEAIVAFPRFRGEASVHTWLERIAIHVCLDHLRQRKVRAHQPLEEMGGDPVLPDAAASPDQVVDARRQLLRLACHLDALPARRRVAFVLHVVDGLPINEVASLVGASAIATRSRIFWARRALEARLAADPVLRQWLLKETTP